MSRNQEPWKLWIEPAFEMQRHMVPTIQNEAQTRLIAVICHDKDEVANAHLVVAAPDLLAACEAFVAAYEKSLQLEKTDVALAMAREAIAKAKGEEL